MRRVPRDHRGDPALTLKVVTYNVLADAYVSPEYCPHTPLECLEPRTRRARLLDHLVRLDADVLTLQELEPSVYAAIRERLAGYDARFAQKREEKPDGCAIFVRRSAAAIELCAPLYYRDRPYPEGPDTGHLALIAEIAAGDLRVSVATTHLKWQPPDTPSEASWPLREARELAQRIIERGGAWVVTGDLNAQPDTEPLRTLLGAGLADVYAGTPDAFTANSNQKAKRIDYLLHTKDLVATPLPIPRIDDVTPLPSETEPSDHLAIGADIRQG